MVAAIRFITGIALGFDISPAPGVYVTIYLGIFEIAFFNPEEIEE
jgi:hypothetical protein